MPVLKNRFLPARWTAASAGGKGNQTRPRPAGSRIGLGRPRHGTCPRGLLGARAWGAHAAHIGGRTLQRWGTQATSSAGRACSKPPAPAEAWRTRTSGKTGAGPPGRRCHRDKRRALRGKPLSGLWSAEASGVRNAARSGAVPNGTHVDRTPQRENADPNVPGSPKGRPGNRRCGPV